MRIGILSVVPAISQESLIGYNAHVILFNEKNACYTCATVFCFVNENTTSVFSKLSERTFFDDFDFSNMVDLVVPADAFLRWSTSKKKFFCDNIKLL